MFARKWVALLSLLLLVGGTADAAVVTFRFTGTVVYGGDLAPVGTTVTGTFSYDTRTKPAVVVGDYAAYQIPEPHDIVVMFGDRIAVGHRINAEIQNDFGGNVEDTVSLGSNGVLVDEAFQPQGGIYLVFASGPGNTDVFSKPRLPSAYDVAEYDAIGSPYGVIRRDGSENGTLLQFDIDSVEVIRVCHPAEGNAGRDKCGEP